MDKYEHKTGATRDSIGDVRFDLISPIGLRRLASICGKGAKRHGERNWEKGMPISDIINHAMNHLTQYMDGDRSEDFPAKIAWAMFAVMHMEERCAQMCDTPIIKREEGARGFAD